MLRLQSLAIAIALFPHYSSGDDKAQPGVISTIAGAGGERAARVLENPNDVRTLKSYLDAVSLEIRMLTHVYVDLDAADRGQAQVATLLGQLQPMQAEAKAVLERGQREYQSRARAIAIARASLSDLEAAFAAKPDDEVAFSNWNGKYILEFARVLYRDVDQAQRMQTAANAFAKKIASATNNERIKSSMQFVGGSRGFGRGGGEDARFTAARALLATIGQEAKMPEARTWINGEAPTPDDLKGKVVLLHYWNLGDYRQAIIPHLRDWEKRYARHGLILITILGQLNYVWDDEEHQLRYVRSREPGPRSFTPGPPGAVAVPPAEFQEAIRKMAKHETLNHRIAFTEGQRNYQDVLNSRGGLTVIDREGKIRMIRVAPFEKEALEVGKLLAETVGASDEK